MRHYVRMLPMLLALTALVSALLVHVGLPRWLLTPPAMGQAADVHRNRAAVRPRPVMDEEIHPPGTLRMHDWRLGELERSLRDLRAEMVEFKAEVRSDATSTSRLLIVTLVGIAVTFGHQLLRDRRPRNGRNDPYDG